MACLFQRRRQQGGQGGLPAPPLQKNWPPGRLHGKAYYMSFVCIPVDGNDHQIGNAAVGCQRPPQRVHLTHDLPETPFHVDTHQCVDPRDPEQETEVYRPALPYSCALCRFLIPLFYPDLLPSRPPISPLPRLPGPPFSPPTHFDLASPGDRSISGLHVTQSRRPRSDTARDPTNIVMAWCSGDIESFQMTTARTSRLPGTPTMKMARE